MVSPYFCAYRSLEPHAVELNLGKYCDIYEITQTNIKDAELIADVEPSDVEFADTLQDLKSGLQELHVLRKLFLCTLLALDADGGKSDFQRWSSANERMVSLSSMTAEWTSTIDEIIAEEDGELGESFFLSVCTDTST